MLLTVFTIGGARYAVDAAQIVEVLPVVHIEPIPHAALEVAGTANYHGSPIVVIDLHRLAGRASAPRRLSTRILLVRHARGRIGLLAAGATDTVQLLPDAFIEDEPAAQNVAWLGPRARHGAGFIQRLEVEPLARIAGAPA